MNPNPELKTRLYGQFKSLLAVQAAVLSLCLVAAHSQAQTYTILHSFGTNVMGLNPQAPLVQGPDGTFYGTTAAGGSANQGQVFKVNADGTGYTVLKDFNGDDGADPNGGLVLSGTTLYGTASGGGSNGFGTVFAVNTDGSEYTVLKEFTGDDGANPNASLVLSGTTLYGTTADGGTNGIGTVFKVGVDGTGFAVLHNFVGWPSDGRYPYGCLVLSGTTLYGTTPDGGTNDNGTVFAINTDGSGFIVLKEFTGEDGADPFGSLVLSGTTLYGTTAYGGSYWNGTVFQVNTDGNDFAVLKDFTNSTDGIYPNAGLLLSGTTLYGTTFGSGSDFGTLFKLNTDGSDFSVLMDFGDNPNGGLMLSGTTLYGTTAFGGHNGYGTIFKVETDGSDYTVVTDFAGGDGVNPYGNLLSSGTTLYGATYGGGEAGLGTLFKISADGSGYTVLKEFNWDDGVNPSAGLVLSGTTLYGTTSGGGNYGSGTVFKINTNGSGFTLLYQFSAVASNGSDNTNADGANPGAGLTLEGTTLYGTATFGGSNANGTVFKLNTDGSGYSVLHTFSAAAWIGESWTNEDGARPYNGLVISGTTLYGTTGGYGRFGCGTLFKVNTDGSEFGVLKHFAGWEDGGFPGGLVISGTTLYGVTDLAMGAVYKINVDGGGYTVLKAFNGDDGVYPDGSLLLSGTTLYGMTVGGGISDDGTVFQVNTDGSSFAVLNLFTGSDGAHPQAGLVLSGATMYGTTRNGGGLDSGVLFSLLLTPSVFVPPQSQTIEVGSTINLNVQTAGAPPLSYQWFRNGTNVLNCTNSALELNNADFSCLGVYTMVITNVFGAVTSAPITINVITPVERRPVPAINLMAQPGSALGLDYCDALSLAGNWENMATMTLSSNSQYYCDITTPLPSQRFYRAWQTGTPSVVPSLNLNFVPAITLTGNVSDKLRLDCINQIGPTDAWVTLDTVTLTNASQLYFDTSAVGQPAQLYRIVPVP